MKDSTIFAILILVLVGVYFLHVRECFDDKKPNTKTDHPCPPNSVKCPSGDCKLKDDLYGLCGYTP
jgi:hypothetical protein